MDKAEQLLPVNVMQGKVVLLLAAQETAEKLAVMQAVLPAMVELLV